MKPKLLNILKRVYNFHLDPVKCCKFNIDKSCGSVDGFCCDMKTCLTKELYDNALKQNDSIPTTLFFKLK